MGKTIDKKTSLSKLGVTPGKLALIGVLSVVLIVVVYTQFGTSPDNTASTAGASFGPRRPVIAAAPASASQPPAATPVASAPVEDKSEQLSSTNASPTKTEFTGGWQEADLAKVVAYDPFALPPSFPQRLKAGEEEKLAKEVVNTEDAKALEAARADAIKAMQTDFVQLQREGVHVIMQNNDKYVALVGERTIHVGDEIEGFTVVAIDAEGVRVARDLKQ